MPSGAYVQWTVLRRKHITELFDVHATVGGSGSGRRWRTQQINWAITLRIAAEFQGFSRSLHDEVVDAFAQAAAPLNMPLQSTLRALLTAGRALDRGNAHPGSLGADFGRFGMQLWPSLGAYGDGRSTAWRDTLEALNRSRNAIAHANEAEIAALANDGWTLSQLDTVRRFHRATDSLASAMDTVTSNHIERMFGGGRPW